MIEVAAMGCHPAELFRRLDWQRNRANSNSVGFVNGMLSHLFSLRSLACMVAMTVLVEFGAELGQYLSFPPREFATCWPPSGIIIAILSIAPRMCWPSLLIGAMLGNLLHNQLGSIDPLTNAVFTFANMIEVSLGGFVLQRLFGVPFRLNSITRVITFVAVVGLGCSTFSALLGALMVNKSGTIGEYWSDWFLWWAADVVGMVLFAPLVLAGYESISNFKQFTLAKASEALVLYGGLAAMSAVIFLQVDADSSPLRFPFYTFPVLAWAGISFGRSGAAIATFVVGMFAMWATSRGYGVFASPTASVTSQALVLQAFVMVTMLTSVLFSVVFESLLLARTELLTTNNLLTAIMEGTSDGAFVKDISGRYLLINSAGAKNFGRPVEEVVGKTDRELIGGELAERVKARDQAIIASGQVTTSEDTVTIAGHQRTYLTTKGPYRDAQGKVLGLAGISADITRINEVKEQLKRSNESLEQRVAERTAELTSANEQLRLEMVERSRVELRLREQQAELAHVSRLGTMGEMAAGLAHELNQPLHAISNYARGAVRRLDAAKTVAPELREALAEVIAEADRAAAILRRVRSFVSKRPFARLPLLVDDLIRNVSTLMTVEANHRHTRLELKLGASQSWVLGDSVQLEQVLVNLVRNGLEAMESIPESQRHLQIESSLDGDGVAVEVRDCGTGLPEALTKQIFDAFFTTKPHGLGMGLAISHSIIEAHDGRLECLPRESGGTTFRFVIPTADREAIDLCVSQQASGDAAPTLSSASAFTGSSLAANPIATNSLATTPLASSKNHAR